MVFKVPEDAAWEAVGGQGALVALVGLACHITQENFANGVTSTVAALEMGCGDWSALAPKRRTAFGTPGGAAGEVVRVDRCMVALVGLGHKYIVLR